MKAALLLPFFVCVFTPAFSQTEKDRQAILSILDRQTAEWNAGNIDAFMKGYWESDSLAFVGANGPTYGYINTFNNYKKRYPDRATMGTLKFEILRLHFITPVAATVIGKWNLNRPEKGNVGGFYTLVFKNIKGQWLIVSDHTS